MGAIAAVGDAVETVRTELVIERAQVQQSTFDEVRTEELDELRRREAAYRGNRPPVQVAGRPVILVDDGLATGATMRAAVTALRRQEPARITAAVPIGSPATCAEVAPTVDEMLCLETPRSFRAVGQGYADFAPTSDDEVREALVRARTAAS
jgi:predicted phosphoribosyltransferase